MLTRCTLAILIALTTSAIGSDYDYSYGHVGYVVKDPNVACNGAPPLPSLDSHMRSVFAVVARRNHGWVRVGTATLIDDSGIFVTAAHVVHDDRTKGNAIALEQNIAQHVSPPFEVEPISSTDKYESYDFVLLQAKGNDWRKDSSRLPYPLRLDTVTEDSVRFIGYEESTEQAVKRDVHFYTTVEGGVQVYTGVLFNHSSGALLFDHAGRAFAVVVKHGVPKITSLNDVAFEQWKRENNSRDMVPTFSMARALPTLIEHVPPSHFMKELIDRLATNVDLPIVPTNLHELASPTDLIHLVDALVLGRVGQRWSDQPDHAQLVQRILMAAGALCVQSRFADDYARLRKQYSDPTMGPGMLPGDGATPPLKKLEYRPEIGLPVQFAQATAVSPDQAHVPDSLLRRLHADSLETAGELGTMFLERALVAQRDEPELLTSHIQLSLALLRRAAADERVRQSLQNGATNRTYATILGNLALAESLGSKQRIGSDEAARVAILASTALGGSLTAYELAARYALTDTDADPAAAVGLFSRAYAMVRVGDPRAASIRRALDLSYQFGLTKTSLKKVDITLFDPSQLSNAGASRWRRLAARRLIQFEFNGIPIALNAPRGGGVDSARILSAEQTPADWLTYHGSYRSYHYSALDQINAGNVANLNVAWIHIPGRSTRGLQSMPLVADGVLYYTGSYSRTFALNGATGEVIWSYFPELDEALISRQTHSPYNRGVALGEGKVYVGTMDGRLIALDMKTGKAVWDTKLIDSRKLTVGFTGAPLYAKGTVVIGSQGGEWPGRGPIFGVDADTGRKKWEFLTVAGTDVAMKTWGNDSWRTGGGGGWMPGTYDSETNTILWGTANPAPPYDWSGADYKTQGARPGDNLYTTSVIALDLDTGKLKSYHQELPHDAWDFDSAVGEFVMLERDGQKLVVHPNKSGFVFVYDRNLGLKNVWRLVQNINFVKNIDPKTGELIGRRDLSLGTTSPAQCPASFGGVSWNSGAYSPKTGLYYKIAQEWCMELEVVKTTPITAPTAQLNIGAQFKTVPPPDGPIRGHLDARDPITGEKKWEINYPEPPLASLLATGGNLLFVPDARGVVHAYNAESGTELWNHNNGTGHQGGIVSYAVEGKQYIAVTAGFGGMATDDYATLFGEPYKSMPRDAGVLVVFTLKQ